jgi:methylmalonyl-CoA mutase
MLADLHKFHADKAKGQIKQVQMAAINNKNIFEELMEITKTSSLGQITNALFEVGGQYRRNM